MNIECPVYTTGCDESLISGDAYMAGRLCRQWRVIRMLCIHYFEEIESREKTDKLFRTHGTKKFSTEHTVAKSEKNRNERRRLIFSRSIDFSAIE